MLYFLYRLHYLVQKCLLHHSNLYTNRHHQNRRLKQRQKLHQRRRRQL
jgi:hypothetical protein